MARPSQPTGLTVEVSSNSIKISWVANSESDIKGYNVYNSTTSGGGVSGYVKLNNELVSTYNELKDIVTNSTTTVEIIGGQRVTTVVDNITPTYFYAYNHINLLEEKTQYYVITAVNNSDEESLYSIEVYGIPLIITTSIVEYPVRTANDVSLSMITKVLDRQPNIDVKPGTMTRDLHIDPHASEFGSLYIYIDFLVKSQSFITLLNIDDPNNTGTSIAVSDSTYKQQLKDALQLATDADVQNVIDFAFDALAGNFKVYRNSATASVGEVVFYTTIEPTATITVPQGTVISTTATSAKPAINFETLSEVRMIISSIDSYYNPATQRYEVTASVQAIDVGEQTNVASNTITNSTFTQLQVTNIKPTEGGQDRESNNHFASRAMLAFTGLDVGTQNGYLKTAIETQYVQDVLVVDAGHPLMQRDYDPVRGRHLYGKVDIYFKGNVIESHSDTFGFLFAGTYREDMSISSSIIESAASATNMRIYSVNPDVSAIYPIYYIQEIINVTKSDSFDLTGNFTLFKNAVELLKSKYTLNLTTGEIELVNALTVGDSITADYEYKVDVTGEIVLAAAIGGEVSVFLDATSLGKNVSIFTDEIYLNRINTFSIDPSTNEITILPRHVYHTADAIKITSTGTMPSPLIASTTYYVIKITNTRIKLATTAANAIAGIAIDILTSGVGTLYIQPATAITLLRDVDYKIYYKTVGAQLRGKIIFSFISFPTGLVSGDAITADYKYVEPVIGEVVIASASGGETTAQLANGNIVEAINIESNGSYIDINNTNAINSIIDILPSDIIRMTYKYKNTSPVIFSDQPVEDIISVVTMDGDVLEENVHYVFNKVDDILLEGNSTKTSRSIQLMYDANTGLPKGQLLENTDSVSLPANEYVTLSKKGIDENTIVVTNLAETITYVLNNDYLLMMPDTTFNYMSIARSITSSITSGQTVKVSYKYGEPVTVTYNINSLIGPLQEKIDVKRHVTADVLVKLANKIDVDLEFTVKLKFGASSPVVKDLLASNIGAIFNQKKMGQRISQSDIIAVIDDSKGVDYVVLPLTKMVVSDGTHIANEQIPKNSVWSVHLVNIVTAYKTISGILQYSTAGSASDSSKFWRISEDDVALTLVNSAAEVAGGASRGYIANDGTVYVSTRANDNPAAHVITVAYNVSGESGTHDIVTTDLDYLNLNSLTIHTI